MPLPNIYRSIMCNVHGNINSLSIQVVPDFFQLNCHAAKDYIDQVVVPQDGKATQPQGYKFLLI